MEVIEYLKNHIRTDLKPSPIHGIGTFALRDIEIGEPIFYLWPKMTNEDIEYLDNNKRNDKEWKLLRNEENVLIITLDDLEGVSDTIISELKSIKDKPLKGDCLKLFNKNVKIIVEGLINDTISIKKDIVKQVIKSK